MSTCLNVTSICTRTLNTLFILQVSEKVTVVAMEVLIYNKYNKILYNSFSQVDESFGRKMIIFLQNCSISLLFVCDWSIRSEVKSNWLTG